MPTNAIWYNEEKDIAHFTYEGHWTWDEYYEGTYKLYDLMKSVNHPVDVIVEYLEGSSQPSGNPYVHWKNTSEKAPPNRGNMVIVGNMTSGAEVDLSNKIIGNSWTKDGFHYARTAIDAENSIKDMRSKE